MNKKANLYLNILEFIFFGIALLSMGAYLNTFMILGFFKYLLFLCAAVSGLLFIGIELFLWMIMNTKSKLLDIAYFLIEIICAVYATTIIPYSGFIVFLCFNFFRDFLRITLVERIYIPKEFDYYCKMFGIKIKDFPKKKKPIKSVPAKEILVETIEKKSKVARKKAA